MNFKDLIIYTDIDGTASYAIGKNPKVSKANLDALKEFIKNGGMFGVASGRNHSTIKEIFKGLDINMPYVESNGATIYDDKNNKYVDINYLNCEAKRYIYDLVSKDPSLSMTALDFNESYRVKMNNKSDDVVLDFERNFITYEELLNKEFLKCAILAKKENIDRVLPIIENVQSEFEMKMARSANVYIEIFSDKAGKGEAIKKAVEYMKLNNKKLVCIGDNYNDIEMLKNADIALCPNNAVTDVKDICEYITNDCKNDALKSALDYLRSR